MAIKLYKQHSKHKDLMKEDVDAMTCLKATTQRDERRFQRGPRAQRRARSVALLETSKRSSVIMQILSFQAKAMKRKSYGSSRKSSRPGALLAVSLLAAPALPAPTRSGTAVSTAKARTLEVGQPWRSFLSPLSSAGSAPSLCLAWGQRSERCSKRRH